MFREIDTVTAHIGFNIFANGTDWLNCDCTDDATCNEETVVYNSGMLRTNSTTPATVLTAIPFTPLANGTMIPFIDIKGSDTLSIDQGIVSLYINDTATDWLIWDVPIPAFTQSSVEPTYRTKVLAMINLLPGYAITASVNISNYFNVIAFASDVTNCPCSS